MAKFNVKIVTPEKSFFEGDVDSILLDTTTGRVEILANHIPYAAGIVPTVLKIKKDDEVKYAALSGGLLEFKDNRAIVLSNSAEWPEEIDVERAKKAKERAEERLKSGDKRVNKERAKLALRRAEARLKAVERAK
ncbi:ATP synthase F1 subunit epsilon [Fonticella tunisiensis]|uniref:ATP synthase epsilon chain n=1 Tax=Fonticella tunisiensis TaxID=1096341 RepID=A0A4R7KS14_9CLOT|nr:ATP synthase F1 subunit epsilon [Fonticella tunisiensis]TDT62395.1 ATP synthase F1 subcomplex epsilon subunit [Fonticella tunisiensis]